LSLSRHCQGEASTSMTLPLSCRLVRKRSVLHNVHESGATRSFGYATPTTSRGRWQVIALSPSGGARPRCSKRPGTTPSERRGVAIAAIVNDYLRCLICVHTITIDVVTVENKRCGFQFFHEGIRPDGTSLRTESTLFFVHELLCHCRPSDFFRVD
jgi:hypothetical protein